MIILSKILTVYFYTYYAINMFYVASDIHLEFHTSIEAFTTKILDEILDDPIENRILFLCGDIGHPFKQSYSDFMKFCSNNFKYVLIISGNHEYYDRENHTHTMDEIDNQIDMIVKSYSNLYFLNNSYCVLSELRIIVVGSTLWSKLDIKTTYKAVNDFINIVTTESKKTNSNLTIQEYNELHTTQLNYLCENVAEIAKLRKNDSYDNMIMIVMTHHLPSYKLIASQYEGNTINQFFATDLDNLIQSLNADPYSCISHWFCGHTHTRMETNIHGTNVIVNPYGHPHEFEQKDRKVLRKISLSCVE